MNVPLHLCSYLIDRVDISVTRKVPVPDPEQEPQKPGWSESNEPTFIDVEGTTFSPKRGRWRKMIQVPRRRSRAGAFVQLRDPNRDRNSIWDDTLISRIALVGRWVAVGRSPVGATWLAADPSPPPLPQEPLPRRRRYGPTRR